MINCMLFNNKLVPLSQQDIHIHHQTCRLLAVSPSGFQSRRPAGLGFSPFSSQTCYQFRPQQSHSQHLDTTCQTDLERACPHLSAQGGTPRRLVCLRWLPLSLYFPTACLSLFEASLTCFIA